MGSIESDTDEWIVVDARGTSVAAIVRSKTPPAKSEVAAFEGTDTTEKATSEPSLPSETEALQSETSHVSDPPAFAFSNVLRSVNDFQRVSLGLYDLYSDQLQGKFLEFKETAAIHSRWALQRARSETQRMFATLSATEVSAYMAQNAQNGLEDNANTASTISAAQDGVYARRSTYRKPAHGNLRRNNDAELENRISHTLIPALHSANVSIYDGRDFKEWFADARPTFDVAISNSEPTCSEIACGVKLYSMPSVAAAIDQLDLSDIKSADALVEFFHEFFDDRRDRMRKYKQLLAASLRS